MIEADASPAYELYLRDAFQVVRRRRRYGLHHVQRWLGIHDLWYRKAQISAEESECTLPFHDIAIDVSEALDQKLRSLLVIGILGGERHSVRAAGRVSPQGSAYADREPQLSTREIARTLVRSQGSLEVLLMLADAGPTDVDNISREAVSPERLLQVVADLSKHDLITVVGNAASLTESGKTVVEKLRRSTPAEA